MVGKSSPASASADIGHANDARNATAKHGFQYRLDRIRDKCRGTPVSFSADSQAMDDDIRSQQAPLDVRR